MALIPWWESWAEGVVSYAGALLVWALGLYVATRSGLHRGPLLTALAAFTVAVYLLGQSLAALAPDQGQWLAWQRRTWWAATIAPPLWLLVTMELFDDEGPEEGLKPPRLRRLWWPLAIASLALAILFAVVGTGTDLLVRWSEPFAPPRPLQISAGASVWHVPPGPLVVAFHGFVLACLLWAATNVTLLWRFGVPRTPLRARFGWLVISAAFFVLSGAYITIGSRLLAFPALPGEVLLVVGMIIVGWNVARYGALLSGEVVTRDFIAFGLAMLAIVTVYGGVILILAPPDYGWLERTLPLLLMVMATHVVVDTRGHLLDRLLFGPVLSVLRGQLRTLANRVVREPDPLTALADVRESVDAMMREHGAEIQQGEAAKAQDVRPAAVPALLTTSQDPPETQTQTEVASAPAPAEFRLLVEGALRHLNNLPALSEHPLLARRHQSAGAHVSALERAAALRGEFEQAIARLRPPGGSRPTPGSSAGPGGWLHYLVLQEAYVEGRPNKQIMQRYLLSEGTFHRARRRAIDAVALDLRVKWSLGAEPSSS